jgi:hypothetical protein
MPVSVDPEATREWKEVSPMGYDLRRDLVRFYEFAFRNHPELLEPVIKIKAGRGHQDMVLDLLARSAVDPKEVNEAKDVLHRAYTYYKQAADEVKAHGQFVFEGTDRYQAYLSDYHQSIRKQAAKTAPETAAPEAVQ